jgi:hypothetical protein
VTKLVFFKSFEKLPELGGWPALVRRKTEKKRYFYVIGRDCPNVLNVVQFSLKFTF